MTSIQTALRDLVSECERLDKEATKGPWGWRYCVGGKPDLFAQRSGLPLVMDAVRSGMNRATLRFVNRSGSDKGGLMQRAEEFFEVPGKNVPDFQDSKNPDAAFIARSRELLPRLAAVVKTLMKTAEEDYWYGKKSVVIQADFDELRAALGLPGEGRVGG